MAAPRHHSRYESFDRDTDSFSSMMSTDRNDRLPEVYRSIPPNVPAYVFTWCTTSGSGSFSPTVVTAMRAAVLHGMLVCIDGPPHEAYGLIDPATSSGGVVDEQPWMAI